jgi:hypothetical protein
MRAALALSVALLVPLANCAAEQGRIHAPPGDDGNASQRDDDQRRDGIPRVRYDRPFRLAYGRWARIEGRDVRIRFAELLEDSRCPADVQCIQAGRARVRLQVRSRFPPVSIELGTDPDASLRSAGGVTWELQSVEPYPAAGAERTPAQYVITLVAHPLRSR